MPVNAVVTAKFGPDKQATAMPLNGCQGVLILPDRKIIQFLLPGDTNTPPMKEFDLTTVTAITVAIAGSTYTVTVS